MIYHKNDRLGFTALCLKGIALITIVAFVTLIAMLLHRPFHPIQVTGTVISQIGLNSPALVPSGRVLRNMENADPAIDIRHSPYLPLIKFSPEAWTVDSIQLHR